VFKKYLLLYILVIPALFGACSDTNNFKKAVVEKTSSRVCIKLFGKRRLMAHSPNDLLSDNTYIDSLLIYTPQLIQGETDNIEIPVPEGDYKIQGKIIIKGKTLMVTLFTNNTTEKRLIPSDWNGKYDF